MMLTAQMLLSLASSLNSVPLPPMSNRHGLRLPPPEHCLTNVNFAIVPEAPPESANAGGSAMQAAEEADAERAKSSVPPEATAAGGADADADVAMDDATQDAAHGTKRSLEEDEEYD